MSALSEKSGSRTKKGVKVGYAKSGYFLILSQLEYMTFFQKMWVTGLVPRCFVKKRLFTNLLI